MTCSGTLYPVQTFLPLEIENELSILRRVREPSYVPELTLLERTESLLTSLRQPCLSKEKNNEDQ